MYRSNFLLIRKRKSVLIEVNEDKKSEVKHSANSNAPLYFLRNVAIGNGSRK